MWVAELACVHGHRFEGWFGSKDDFEAQQRRGLVGCPQCGSVHVQRQLTAPRLNFGATQAADASVQAAPTPAPAALPLPPDHADPAAVLRELIARVVANTEDVGPCFAQEARLIHADKAPDRPIRGQATPQEHEALREEGIEVFALPMLSQHKASSH